MKLLVSVFTHDANVDYFRICCWYLKDALRKMKRGWSMHTMVVDFSDPLSDTISDSIKDFPLWDFEIFRRPSAGFCSNMNFSIDYAQKNDYNFMASLNDDAFISPNFLRNGLKYLSDDSAVGFLGGIPQKGFWNQSAVNVRIPPDDPAVDEEISNFARLHWEMSACFLNPGVVGDVRFDPAFDDFLGLCGDNDFLISLARRGVPVRRWGGLRFYHCRGVTQARFGRKPFLVCDPVKEGAWE